MTRTDRRLVVGAAILALVLATGAISLSSGPRQLDAAPVDLAIPTGLTPDQLGQWCVDRQAAGTAGLSRGARNWLEDCIELFGAGITPGPTGSPTVVPTSPSPSMSPTATQPPTPSPTVTQPSPSPTSTPTPTPTTTGPVTNCYANPGRCGFPDAATAGTPAGVALTVFTGNLTVSTAGTVIDGRDIRGCVEVRAANVTIRNSRVAGDCFWAINNFSTGLSIMDTDISCGSVNGTGIGSSNLVALRVEITDCENGLNVSGNVALRDSYLHDLEAGGGAHTDGAQFNQGAANITFDHNTILSPSPGGTSAIIQWDEDNPQNSNVLIARNLLAGGAYTLYCARQGPVTNVRIVDNRIVGGVMVNGDFVGDPGGAAYGPTNGCSGNHITLFSGNVRDLTGAVLLQA